MTRTGFVMAIFAATLTLVNAAPAAAYEDQVTLDLDVGGGFVLANGDAPTAGVGFGVGAGFGLGTAWTLRGRISYALHPSASSLQVLTAGAEVHYALDILKFVPFFGVGIDGIGTVRDGTFGADVAVHALLGLDWLLSRKIVVGIDIRPYVLPFSLADRGIDPVYLSATLRLSVVFDRY